jgi:hypothetical protein
MTLKALAYTYLFKLGREVLFARPKGRPLLKKPSSPANW